MIVSKKGCRNPETEGISNMKLINENVSVVMVNWLKRMAGLCFSSKKKQQDIKEQKI